MKHHVTLEFHVLSPGEPGLRESIRHYAEQLGAMDLKITISEANDNAFEAFWSAYPRKVAKQAARALWRSKHLDAKAPAVMARLAEHIKGWSDPKFIPHPRTYLYQERYNDPMPTDTRQPLTLEQMLEKARR